MRLAPCSEITAARIGTKRQSDSRFTSQPPSSLVLSFSHHHSVSTSSTSPSLLFLFIPSSSSSSSSSSSGAALCRFPFSSSGLNRPSLICLYYNNNNYYSTTVPLSSSPSLVSKHKSTSITPSSPWLWLARTLPPSSPRLKSLLLLDENRPPLCNSQTALRPDRRPHSLPEYRYPYHLNIHDDLFILISSFSHPLVDLAEDLIPFVRSKASTCPPRAPSFLERLAFPSCLYLRASAP